MRFELPENQKLLWVPYNTTTKTLYYNQRMAISQNRETPLAWQCSKVEDMSVNGIIRTTWKQDLWNDHDDYIEKDAEGNVLGIWCDYFRSNIPIIDPDAPQHDPSIYSEVTYSGNSVKMTIKGNFKKFTVTFYNSDGEIALRPGTWFYEIDGVDVTDMLEIKTSDDDTSLSPNQIKVKFIGDDSHIGDNLVIGYESDDHIKSSVTMNLVGL